MNYKMADTDKIEVEAGDLRLMIKLLHDEAYQSGTAGELRHRYPSAFAPEDEWEDVTDKILLRIVYKRNKLSNVLHFCPGGELKIENNRIWRRKPAPTKGDKE